MRSAFSDVIGNERLRTRLCADLQENALAHAYVIEGDPGTGKHLLALRIAMAMSCENRHSTTHPLPCLQCPSCRKIASGNSPDVIYVTREEKHAALGVNPIRDLRMDVYVAPNDLAVKTYIIEEAHLMTEAAQNAFLLTLEEPPSYVLFLLLCDSGARLLETVRSRAPTLRTERVPQELLARELCRISPEAELLRRQAPEEYAELVQLSEGSVGTALRLLDPKLRAPLLARREIAREFVTLCASRKSTAATMKFINALPQKREKREELALLLQVFLACLRDLLLCKQTDGAPLCFFADREEAFALSYRFTTPELLSLCECVSAAQDQLRANANIRLLLIAFATRCGLL
ncbi:MAG: hypothetical protein IIW78_03560 [Clostridia bacterium]|nr:hypothetical protein [Clostridia bacterium]